MKLNLSAICIILCVLYLAHSGSIYADYYSQAVKIVQVMTIEQKIGQMMQVDFTAFDDKKNGTDPTRASKLYIGSLLVGGNGVADVNGNIIDPQDTQKKARQGYLEGVQANWKKLADKFSYSFQVQTKQGKLYNIKPILATDAVHNNQHVSGTILFPHNIGLSCSHNPDNFYNVGYWTGINVRRSGFHYAFAPTVAVSHNPQWGRFYETMGQEDSFIYNYSKAFVDGLQNIKNKKISGAVGSAKHFFGDGSTLYGADEGSADVGSYKKYIDHNIQGYVGSIASDVGTVMASYSGINYIPMAFGPWINTLLKTKLDFQGFVISDYDQVSRIIQPHLPTSFQEMGDMSQGISMMLAAGNDMFMIPGLYGYKYVEDFIEGFKNVTKDKNVTQQRIDDAVARILSVKMALDLVAPANQENNSFLSLIAKGIKNFFIKQAEKKLEDTEVVVPKKTGPTSQYDDSIKAVHQSLVLLKNTGVIPVKASFLEYVVLVGERTININQLSTYELFPSYDNIGMQCGGWTLRWQGFEGNFLWPEEIKKMNKATSILDALKNLNQKFEIVFPTYSSFTETIKIDVERQQYLNKLKTLRKKMNAKNTVILAVIGQSPYAQFPGDVGVPYCQNQTVLGKEGCLYDDYANPYNPQNQKSNLTIEFEKFDKDVINNIREQDKNIPLISVVLAGRPMLINNVIDESSAVMHAFLPGTSGGQGIVDALTGKYVLRPNGSSDRVNSLSFDWPRNSSQLAKFPIYKADGQIPKIQDPLYGVGYGLSTFTGVALD